jgi:hypothetical protein
MIKIMRQICYAYLTSDITSEKTVKNTEGTIKKKDNPEKLAT